MTALASVVSAEDDLDALLSCLGLDEPDTIVPAPVEELVGEFDLEAAVKDAEAQEVLEEHYNAESAEAEVVAAPVDPMSDPAALLSGAPIMHVDGSTVSLPAAPKKAKAPKAPKEPKAPKAPVVRKHYANKSERITDKLGADLGSYTVLELADASLTGDELAAKQTETMEIIAAAGVKVQMRAGYLMEFAAGKAAELNLVATTALKLLKTDGKITTGENGNLHLELIKKYSKGSANSMGNNTIAAMRALKMITLSSKGEYAPNPASLYLMKLNPMIGL